MRSFLRYVQSDISKYSRSGSRFDFRNGSIGNFFLTGGRLVHITLVCLLLTFKFFGSLESSIYLLSSISSLAENITVLPIINTNHSTHIAAKLPCPPYVIVGQNQISHPSLADVLPEKGPHARTGSIAEDEDGTLPPGTLASLNGSGRNIVFEKCGTDALPGKIERVFYVNPYGNEIHPSANPRVVAALRNADSLIYSTGSLFTSYFPPTSKTNDRIVPCLVPKGIAKAMTESTTLKFKILLLNNSFDRETTAFTSATDYIKAIIKACTHPHQDNRPWTHYVTHLVYLRGSKIPVDTADLKARGIECVGIWPAQDGMVYDAGILERVLTGICSGRGGGLQRRATVQNWPIRQHKD